MHHAYTKANFKILKVECFSMFASGKLHYNTLIKAFTKKGGNKFCRNWRNKIVSIMKHQFF